MLKRYWPLLLWFIYLLSPIDLVPDFLFGPGFVDDLLFLLLIYWLFWRKPPAQRPSSGYRGSTRSGADSYRRSQNGSGRGRNGPAPGDSSTLKDPYRILEVERGAAFDEIKKAYLRQAQRYHPDKVAHLGEEFQQLAHRKFKDIQWAYETLKKDRVRS